MNKKITLFTDDPENPQTELTITGKVMRTLEWTPTRFELSAYDKDKGCPEIKIKSLDGTPFSIKGFEATGHRLSADYDPNVEALEFTLKPVLNVAKLEALPVSTGRIKIDLDHRDYETINLSFNVALPFEITPRAIFSMKTPTDKPVLRTLKLQDKRKDSSGDIPSLIESLTFEKGSRVEVLDFTQVDRGCEIKLEIWPNKDAAAGSLWLDKLNIKMKGGQELNVPVYVFYESAKTPTMASSS